MYLFKIKLFCGENSLCGSSLDVEAGNQEDDFLEEVGRYFAQKNAQELNLQQVSH